MMYTIAGGSLMPSPNPLWSFSDLQEVIVRHWGFRTLRSLQDQAIQTVLAGHNSLVVLPTVGGKSLYYQAPAVLRGGTTVVVWPNSRTTGQVY
jgi:ATP-dependent DNA helicase RecQ